MQTTTTMDESLKAWTGTCRMIRKAREAGRRNPSQSASLARIRAECEHISMAEVSEDIWNRLQDALDEVGH